MSGTLETFTQSSDAPYDRHYYVLHLAGGGRSVWDGYEEVRDHWMLNRGWGMTHIEAVDRPAPKPKGF